MYADNAPCSVCGAETTLEPHPRDDPRSGKNPDGTLDERVCTNPSCPSNLERPASETPNP